MESEVKQAKNKNVVKDRAGELTNHTNKQTFELLEKIFGYEGPYRTTLLELGIGNKKYEESFLVFDNGDVLVDIDKENKAVWDSCLIKLENDGKKTFATADKSFTGMSKHWRGYLKKASTDAKFVSNLKKTKETVETKYNEYSSITRQAFKDKSLSEKEFLNAYKNVVYVTYVFELFDVLNKDEDESSSCLQNYLKTYDFLLKYDDSYAELKYKPKEGFHLGEGIDATVVENIDIEELEFIPDELPDCDCEAKDTVLLEKKLQCFKNNMRLMTNSQLFFLNLTLNG